ncbi:MAG: hypothetical protein GWP02_06155 [Desulfobulbaceae bacterium]|nr:hypothetical protein [Desulfobulbaceae bacterium]
MASPAPVTDLAAAKTAPYAQHIPTWFAVVVLSPFAVILLAIADEHVSCSHGHLIM